MQETIKSTVVSLCVWIIGVVAIFGVVEIGLDLYNQRQIDNCLAESQATYSQRWDEECIDEGKEADCSLAVGMADSFRAELNAANTICVERY